MAITCLMGRSSALTLQAVCLAGWLSKRQADLFMATQKWERSGFTHWRFQLPVHTKSSKEKDNVPLWGTYRPPAEWPATIFCHSHVINERGRWDLTKARQSIFISIGRCVLCTFSSISDIWKTPLSNYEPDMTMRSSMIDIIPFSPRLMWCESVKQTNKKKVNSDVFSL